MGPHAGFNITLDPSKLCGSNPDIVLSLIITYSTMPMELPLFLWRLEFLDRCGNAIEIQTCTHVRNLNILHLWNIWELENIKWTLFG